MSHQQPLPAEGPDDPDYTGQPAGTDAGADAGAETRAETGAETGSSGSAGEVSEVQHLDRGDAGTPISPGDSTAGYPPSESGGPDTQGSGPDAAPPENRRDNEMDKDGDQLGESIEDETL